MTKKYPFYTTTYSLSEGEESVRRQRIEVSELQRMLHTLGKKHSALLLRMERASLALLLLHDGSPPRQDSLDWDKVVTDIRVIHRISSEASACSGMNDIDAVSRSIDRLTCATGYMQVVETVLTLESAKRQELDLAHRQSIQSVTDETNANRNL